MNSSKYTLVNVNAPGCCYNELVVAFYSTGDGVKGKKIYTCWLLLFIYKLAFILFVMTPGAQTTSNIAIYGSAKQLVIWLQIQQSSGVLPWQVFFSSVTAKIEWNLHV